MSTTGGCSLTDGDGTGSGSRASSTGSDAGGIERSVLKEPGTLLGDIGDSSGCENSPEQTNQYGFCEIGLSNPIWLYNGSARLAQYRRVSRWRRLGITE